MTSAWNEPPGRDDRAGGGEDAGPDGSDMFEIHRRSGSGRPADASGNGSNHAGRDVEIVSPFSAKRDFLDVGGPDSDELRRLEDSIRWLMDAGNVRHLPPVTAQPVTGPSPLESKRRDLYRDRDDSLILDPETLFPPRTPHRQGDILRGAAKILLVSAIAAPTAYFAASWAQLPSPPEQPVASTSAPAGSVQVAALVPLAQVPEVTTRSIDVATAPPPEHAAAVVEKTPAAGPAELKVAPPEQPSSTSSVPAQSARGDAETASPVIPVAAPPKPALRARR